jgi:HK97 family phage prohead protease
METETKGLTVTDMDEAGKGLAKIASLSAIDHDGDTYMPGAFAWKEQWVPLLPAHNRHAMPFGKARIHEKGDAAYADLYLNLDSSVGRDWHAALKFDLATGKSVQEWSYGFDALDHGRELRDGAVVRVLKRLDVHEISTVVRGAGAGTGTLSLKSRTGFAEQLDQLIADLGDAIQRADDVKTLRAADGRPLSPARIDQLAALKARLDALLASGQADEDAVQKANAELERVAANLLTASARRRARS